MVDNKYKADVVIIGGGLAGIATALELLDHNKSVLIIDRDKGQRFGGMANDAFGGMALVDTPVQRRNGIKDSAELALSDWLSAAEFGEQDVWPKAWAKAYCERSQKDIYEWLNKRNISFFPIVHWVERGEFKPGNSVPRYHVAWGTGYGVTQTLIECLKNHRNIDKLRLVFEHRVTDFEFTNGRVSGCRGENTLGEFEVSADATVICAGGINGNLKQVKKHWDVPTYGEMPDNILSGSHPYADGALHDKADQVGAKVNNLGWMWNYAAGIKNPKPEYKNHGLSLIPPRSSLWMDCYGNRVGPEPLVTGFDTHDLCKRIGHLPKQYSWHIMNWKIAIKELAISGSHVNPSFRDKKFLALVKDNILGNKEMVQNLIDTCEDVVAADNLPELVQAMNAIDGNDDVKLTNMQRDIGNYDDQIGRGLTFYNDDQLRRIRQLRNWRGDKVRTCKFSKINDPSSGPLIAMRCYLISRKSMGGFQTDLHSRVLNDFGVPVEGLYAAGEAAGFGGGGISGIRSLEGTFLSNCIFNGRIAARSIAGISQP